MFSQEQAEPQRTARRHDQVASMQHLGKCKRCVELFDVSDAMSLTM